MSTATPHFNGPEYEPELDDARLTGQIRRVFALMQDGRWRTLDEIATTTGDPHASISAQLRHLRKERFGAHTVNRRARGDRSHGLFEYQVLPGRPAGSVRCVECQHCTSNGVEPKMRRLGVNLCVVTKPDHAGQYLTLEANRQCTHYSAAPQAVVDARRAWLAERAWPAPSTSTR